MPSFCTKSSERPKKMGKRESKSKAMYMKKQRKAASKNETI
jgi:hypothetical protein